MLKKLILENWKSFRYAELPIDPLTVLIGMNASGKSNVIEALEFPSRIASGLDVQTALAGDLYIPPLRGDSIWAAFTHQSELWGAEGLKNLAAEWPDLAMQNISIGDATIKMIVDYYKSSFQVEIFTCDRVLKAYQPSPTTRVPRRRSG